MSKLISKLLMVTVLLFSLAAHAQQSPRSNVAKPTQPRSAQPEPGSEAAEHAAGPSETHATSVSENNKAGISEEKQAAQEEKKSEDAEEKMKKSASVKWIGRKLGLGVEKAYWVSVGLNFLVLAVFIGLIVRSKLPGIFRARTGSIQRQMEEARKVSADASARLADIESRLTRLDTQISEMRSQGEREAAAEEERLRAASEAERRRIVESAEQEISAASSNARRELRHFAAELAVNVAGKRIRVDEATDRNLVHDFASNLNDGQKGGA